MNDANITHMRNLFEVDNARNLSRQELVSTFIPTQAYWRLLSSEHNVILGARGQGKTALAKMLSHDHMALMASTRDEPRVRSAIVDQEFIGIYLPTRLEWVGGLKNKPWLNEQQREELFQWRLNIASCIALAPVAKSCITAYLNGRAEQARTEAILVAELVEDWIGDTPTCCKDLLQLRRHLEDLDYRKQVQLLRERTTGRLPASEEPVGLHFAMELFAPLRRGIARLSRLLSIKDSCSWLLCLDEAEFLEELDHRIINSHMRAYPDNLFLKITTMPYCHHTLDTNIGAPLVPGQDFEYVNMDSDRVLTARASGDPDTIGTLFGRTLFGRLMEVSMGVRGQDSLSIAQVFGESALLDPRREDWDAKSENIKLLEKYGSPKTIARAKRLLGSPGFPSSIGRKINGPLLLRKEVDEWSGNKALTVYSGARMAIRCGDDNPRHIIKVFNALLMTASRQGRKRHRVGITSCIPPAVQTRAMRTLSTTTLNQYRSFQGVGPQLHKFLKMLGDYMRADLHEKPLTTDQVTSVTVDDSVSDSDWQLICIAVGHGLLHPNVGGSNPDELPWCGGTYHLAFALAPHFLLFPRRGKAVMLSTIQRFHEMQSNGMKPLLTANDKQLKLFEEDIDQ